MERIRCSLLVALCFALSSCASAPATNSRFVCEPEELYGCYSEVLEQVLPMELYRFSDIVFRRYVTYARPQNPTEFVASLSLVYRNEQRVIEASYRRLLDENLYMQLASGAPAEVGDDKVATTVNWSEGVLTSGDCPAIVDAWEKARNLKLNDLSDIPQFDVSGLRDEEEIAIRLHARIYEVAFAVGDQTITVVQEGGSTALSDWVEETITALESCNAEK